VSGPHEREGTKRRRRSDLPRAQDANIPAQPHKPQFLDPPQRGRSARGNTVPSRGTTGFAAAPIAL